MSIGVPSSVSRLRIAVVGSGAAAAGVLLGIARRFPDAEVVLLERRRETIENCQPPSDRLPDIDYWRRLYSLLRSQSGLTFPPPKSHFGVYCPRLPVTGRGAIWESGERGGLTNYWGGSAMVFTDRDLRKWPIGVGELTPFYRLAAEEIGISGQADELTPIFSNEVINRPPIRLTETVSRFIQAVNSSKPLGDFEIRAGAARLAVETRPAHPHACTYTGDCMIGCSRGAIYSASSTVEAFIRSGQVSRVIVGKVLAVDLQSRLLTIETQPGDRREQVGPFDLVFLAAGCVGTTEIALRSNLTLDALNFRDNPVASFPVFYAGSLDDPSVDAYFALTNAIVMAVPADLAAPMFSVQVYPAMDHLWRYFVPVKLWELFQPFGRTLRRRLLIGRMYLHSDFGPLFSLSLNLSGKPEVRVAKVGTEQPGAWRAIKAAMRRNGFHVPNVPPVRHNTSAHYSGSLPYGRAGLSSSGEISNRVFACDSSVFPDAPASSPTFTIIANAIRTVYAAADDCEHAK